MFAPLWDALLTQPLLNALFFFLQLTGNLGVAIILLTIALRIVMTPLVLPGLKVTKKTQELAPEITKLKEKYKNDKQGLMLAQAQLFKEHGLNPASGCLPQIIQILILIALFSVFNIVLKADPSKIATEIGDKLYSFNQLPSDFKLTTDFLYMDLTRADVFHIPGVPLPIPGLFLFLSAVTQLISSLMLSPVVAKAKKIADGTPESSDDAIVEAQRQMVYLFPLMTLVVGYQFQAGLVIYWFVFSLTGAMQQYSITGLGGLKPWLKRFNLLKSAD